MNTKATAPKTVLSTATVATLLRENGTALTRARRDLRKFNVEVSASKVLRKIISDNLRELNIQIREGKAGHKNKALVAARAFFIAQYQELLGDKQGYKFTRIQVQQFIAGQEELVLGLDTLWEEKKAEDAANAQAE